MLLSLGACWFGGEYETAPFRSISRGGAIRRHWESLLSRGEGSLDAESLMLDQHQRLSVEIRMADGVQK